MGNIKTSKIKDKIKEELNSTTNSGVDYMHLACTISKLIALINAGQETISEVDFLKIKNPPPHQLESDERAEINDLLKELKTSTNTDIVQLAESIAKNAKSVVLIVNADPESKIVTAGKHTISLESKDLKDKGVVIGHQRKKINKDILYGKQRTSSSLGTGFLFKEGNQHYVITAAHVIFPAFQRVALSNLRFIGLAYAVRNERKYSLGKHTFNNGISVPNDLVLEPNIPEEGIRFSLSSNGEDYAIIPINPPSGKKAKKHLTFLQKKESPFPLPKVDRLVYGLGHGLGLPLKLSPCGKIGSEVINNNKLFSCTLDFFSGNSGSPVFDAETHELIGMLIRGKRDFYIPDDTTAVSLNNLLPETDRDGEVCQHSYFLEDIDGLDLVPTPNIGAIPNSRALTTPLLPLKEHRDLLPYVRLDRLNNGQSYHLYLCLSTHNRSITIIPPYKVGQVTIIDCYLDYSPDPTNTNFKKIDLTGLTQTDTSPNRETIEIRVFDQISGVFHTTNLDYRNAQDIEEQPNQIVNERSDGLYWASCLPEQFYKKGDGKTIGLSIGKFKNSSFIKSSIEQFEIGDYAKEVTLVFTENGGVIKKDSNSSDNINSNLIKLKFNNDVFVFPKPDNIPPRSKPSQQQLIH